MESNINLPAIFIANGFGVILSVIMFLGNNRKLKRQETEYKYIKVLLVATIFSCLVDPIVFLSDGTPGMFSYIAVYFGNFWLFLSNMLVGPIWLFVITHHLFGKVPKGQKLLVKILGVVGVTILIINFFKPVVFSVDSSNVYQRHGLFWLYTAIQAIIITDGIVVYLIAKVKGGVFKFFPVVQFVVPIIIGIAVQGAFYGVSTIWPCIAISVCGLLNSLQNETVYTDSLTGLYNRFYLDTVKHDIERKKIGNIIVMMLDVNGFKLINDRFGHSEGDEALINIAEILRTTVGSLGSVVRYAGDEFVILLNTQEEDIAQGCIAAIRKNINEYNKISGKEYKLSLSVGYCTMDMKNQTVDELINDVDKKMYQDKQKFYDENPDWIRRKE